MLPVKGCYPPLVFTGFQLYDLAADIRDMDFELSDQLKHFLRIREEVVDPTLFTVRHCMRFQQHVSNLSLETFNLWESMCLRKWLNAVHSCWQNWFLYLVYPLTLASLINFWKEMTKDYVRVGQILSLVSVRTSHPFQRRFVLTSSCLPHITNHTFPKKNY